MKKKIVTILFAITILFSLSISPAFALSDAATIEKVKAMNIEITSTDYSKADQSVTFSYSKDNPKIKVDGYMIYSSTSKNSGYKKIKTTSSKKATIKNLEPGKTYYFKIKAYREVDGKKYYTYYSDKVSVKTKKSEKTKANNAASESVGDVYWTATGKRYHSSATCRGLNNANGIYNGTNPPAGLTPCQICW